MSHKRWVYHATKKPKIINGCDFEQMESEGWADSPAKFLKLEDLGIDKAKIDAGDAEEEGKAQQALDMVDGVKESLNKALNIDKMSKNELQDYAIEHYGVDLDKSKSVKVLRKEVKALTEA